VEGELAEAGPLDALHVARGMIWSVSMSSRISTVTGR
jgi:hypothetical protein